MKTVYYYSNEKIYFKRTGTRHYYGLCLDGERAFWEKWPYEDMNAVDIDGFKKGSLNELILHCKSSIEERDDYHVMALKALIIERSMTTRLGELLFSITN